MTNITKLHEKYTYEEVMRYATDDDLAVIRAGMLDQGRMKSIAQRILRGRECDSPTEDPETTLIKDAFSAHEVTPSESNENRWLGNESDHQVTTPRDPSIPWGLIDGGYLVLNADGKTTSLPDDPNLGSQAPTPKPNKNNGVEMKNLNDRPPPMAYIPTPEDHAWCKRNKNDDLPTCFGQSKVRMQFEALKKKKGYRATVAKHYGHLFGGV